MAKQEFEIIPDVTLFGKLGARSRAFPKVITELVDNSLDSWIQMSSKDKKGKTLRIDIIAPSAKGAWFIIKDNAGGMDDETLGKALKVAHSTKTDDPKLLGHYGFGLKSAAMYIGDKFRIYTRPVGSNSVYYVDFDQEKFERAGKWFVYIEKISASEAEKLDVHFPDGHGTEIHIRNKRYSPGSKMGIVNNLRRTFAPRLPTDNGLKVLGHDDKKFAYEKMEIRFNEEPPLVALGHFYEVWQPNRPLPLNADKADPFKGSNKEAAVISETIKWKKETILAPIEIPETKIQGKRIWGRIGLLDRGMAHNNHYGFDLIKNGRVIEQHVLDKEHKEQFIGIIANNYNARIVGQLFMDDWKTDHQKTEFLRDEEGAAVQEKEKKAKQGHSEIAIYVREFVKKFIPASSRMQHPNLGGDGESPDEPKGIALEQFEESLPEISKAVQAALRRGSVKETLSEIEESESKIGSKPPGKSSAKHLPTTEILFTKPHLKFEKLGKNDPMVATKYVKERSGSYLELTLNRSHPFLKDRESAELKAIGEFLAIDAFSEFMFNSRGFISISDFFKLRDKFLRELSSK